MTSSALPQQPGPETPVVQPSVKKRKERSQPTLWSIAGVFFILGSAVTGLTGWHLYKLYRATIAPPIVVEGTLRAQYDYDDVEGLNPPPGGYYIESPGLGRVYLKGKPLQSYVGETIQATGSISGICGPKSIPCFPLIELRNVEEYVATE